MWKIKYAIAMPVNCILAGIVWVARWIDAYGSAAGLAVCDWVNK